MPAVAAPVQPVSTATADSSGIGYSLAIARYRAMRRQMPVLYALLGGNGIAVAIAYAGTAPNWLTVAVPGALSVVVLMRITTWLIPVNDATDLFVLAQATLKRAEALASLIAFCFTAWAMALDQYGNAFQHAHATLFVGVAVIGCIACLTYAPRAARLAAVASLGLWLPYCLIRGPFELIAMAVNIGFVGLLVLKVQADSFEAFVRAHTSQYELREQRSQAQQLSAENARLAHTDALTGLPNRRFFFNRLDTTLSAATPDQPFAIGLIDLDRFKPINDTLGHVQGDRLLALLGQRLSAAAGSAHHGSITVARLGGDEFGMIISGPVPAIEAAAARLAEAIQRPVELGEARVAVGCSLGLAVWPEAGTTAHDLFDRADFALYHAKRRQRGGIVRFSPALDSLVRSEQGLEVALQAADLATELYLVYQPIVAARTQQLHGVEALARWESPTLGAVPAEMLIATAERLGMARQVTLALFDRALADLPLLPDGVHMSFNLTATDLADSTTIAVLSRHIADRGLPPGRILFEITETSLIRDFAVARAALEALRAKGAGVALDDFGTGYSSLSTLNQIEIDLLKIDRSFAARLGDPAGRRLMGAVRNLAGALDVQCVFEGIETETQLIEATLAGFHFIQGYIIARPGPLQQAIAMVAPAMAARNAG